tara:strand:- start:28 stop:393 length:366 start_codon:yes stop_codon:yes gene_type:complete
MSFKTLTNTSKEIAFQAIQVQSVLREDLHQIYIENPTLENESNFIDAKYVEGLLLKIVKEDNSSDKQTISEAARVQTVLKEELYEIYLQTGNLINEKRYVDAKYVESLIVSISNGNDSSNN